jgi:hypothetical protein
MFCTGKSFPRNVRARRDPAEVGAVAPQNKLVTSTMAKITESADFLHLDWWMPREILLDSRCSGESRALAHPICGGLGPYEPSMSWFRLWGVARHPPCHAKEKTCTLSILQWLPTDVSSRLGC